jgi:uncharacterized protein
MRSIVMLAVPDLSDMSPLAKAAVPDHSTEFSSDLMLWREHMPGGLHWSALLRRGNTLRITVQGDDANASALFFNFDERSERYNMPDTLKAQETAYLRKGHVCYSDMGRILCSLPESTCAWHDTIGGLSDAGTVAAKYGIKRFQEHRNSMYRNGRDGFLVQLGKWGLGKRDLVPNINFFSKVAVVGDGTMQFVRGNSKAHDFIDLRFEMNTIVVLSTCQHRLDPNTRYEPRPVELACWRSGTAGKDDICRHARPENGRGFINTERFFL